MVIGQLAWGSEPAGLLIFCEPPATYAESVEYTAIQRTSPIFSTIRRADGKSMEVQNKGVLGYVQYPTSINHPGFDEEANAALTKINGFIAQYPQLRTRLETAQTRWANALAVFSRNKPREQMAAPETSTAVPRLVFDGKSYSGVTLDAVYVDSVSVSHSDGVAKIPLEKLSPEQILALNRTSKTKLIGADWKEKLTQYNEAQKATLEAQKKAAEMARAKPPAGDKPAPPQMSDPSSTNYGDLEPVRHFHGKSGRRSRQTKASQWSPAKEGASRS